jgi:ArsR family transcriptional regulator, arsenate/arsenite/antimonite-responsive transcriptional repressor / arsenate reductase (thioredoxin)
MSTDQKPIKDSSDRDRRARVLSALGDVTRLAVVDLLQVQDLSPDALAAALEIPGNLLAHHLKVLQSAGLITRRHSQHDRRRTYIHLVDDALDGLLPQAGTISASRVVFVCTHNSARSVLAEALWREASDVPAASAGTHPAEHVNPRALKVGRRAGLAMDTASPQSVDAVLRADDLVVSVCDTVNEELDDLANPHLHWSIPDPAAVGTDAAFTAALSDISERVDHLATRVHYRRHAARSTS